MPASEPATAPSALKRTSLYDLHRELGAKLIDFGGWEMPVQYSGILQEHRAVRERVGIFDVSHMGELEVSGAGALAALQWLTPNDVTRLSDGRCHYSAFREISILGEPTLVSRTGYTGEDGFEICLASERAEKVFRRLLEEGRDEGILPCGLGARDTLRLEAKMALYGNDIDDTVTPWEADLGWTVKMKKGDFIGRDVLARQREEGVPRKLVGFDMIDRGIARHGYAAQTPEGPGVVTSGTHSPTFGKPIGLALLPMEASEIGEEFSVDIRGREARAHVVPTPFYKRAKEVPA